MFYQHLTYWACVVLWLKFDISAASVFLTEKELDDFPYTIRQHDFSEQSPINIITKNAKRLPLPHLHCHYLHPFNKATATLTNSGRTIVVKLTNNTQDVPTVIGGPLFNSTYKFEQMHFHWNTNDYGSEHEVDGKKYAIELHMVHYKAEYGSYKNARKYDDGLCVVGVFGNISQESNPEMNLFIRDLKFLRTLYSTVVRNFRKEFSWVKRIALKQSYYTYHGSLTTEPFTECVIWIIFTHTFNISRRQLMKFRRLHSSIGYVIQTNDRTIQPSNNRPVDYVHD